MVDEAALRRAWDELPVLARRSTALAMAGAATWMLVPGSFVLYLLLFVATSNSLLLLLALLVALLGFMFAMARVLVLALPAHPIAQLRPKLVTFLAALPFIFLVAGLVLNPTKPLHPVSSIAVVEVASVSTSHHDEPSSEAADDSQRDEHAGVSNHYSPREAFCRSAWFLQLSLALSLALPFAAASLPSLLVTFPAVQQPRVFRMRAFLPRAVVHALSLAPWALLPFVVHPLLSPVTFSLLDPINRMLYHVDEHDICTMYEVGHLLERVPPWSAVFPFLFITLVSYTFLEVAQGVLVIVMGEAHSFGALEPSEEHCAALSTVALSPFSPSLVASLQSPARAPSIDVAVLSLQASHDLLRSLKSPYSSFSRLLYSHPSVLLPTVLSVTHEHLSLLTDRLRFFTNYLRAPASSSSAKRAPVQIDYASLQRIILTFREWYLNFLLQKIDAVVNVVRSVTPLRHLDRRLYEHYVFASTPHDTLAIRVLGAVLSLAPKCDTNGLLQRGDFLRTSIALMLDATMAIEECAREMSRTEGKELLMLRHVIVHREAFVLHNELRMCLLSVVRTYRSTVDRLEFTEQQLAFLRAFLDPSLHVGE